MAGNKVSIIGMPLSIDEFSKVLEKGGFKE